MKKIVIALFVLFFYEKTTAQTTANTTDSVEQNRAVFTNAAWQTTDLGDGLTWQHCHFSEKQLFSANQNIHILRLQNGGAKVRLAFATAADSLVETSKLAAKSSAIAAINGSFFDTKKGGAVDFIRINGKIFDTTRTPTNRKLAEHQRSAIVIGDDGTLKIVRQTDTSDLKWAENLDAKNVMVTGPNLIFADQNAPLSKSPFNDNRHPRTAVGVTDQNDVILLTADGRTADAYGLNLSELTFLMRFLGCRDAVNLDGGGSTTMWISGKSDPSGVVNMPCDNKKFDHEGERKVSNILMLLKN